MCSHRGSDPATRSEQMARRQINYLLNYFASLYWLFILYICTRMTLTTLCRCCATSICYLGTAIALPTSCRKSARSCSSDDDSSFLSGGYPRLVVFHNQNKPRTASCTAIPSSS